MPLRTFLEKLHRVPADSSQRLRADLLASCGVLFSAFGVFFTAHDVFFGVAPMAVCAFALTLACLGNLYALHRTSAVVACSHVFIAQMVLGLCGIAWLTGGGHSLVLTWIFPALLLAFILGGPHTGVSWSLIAGGVIVSWFVLEGFGIAAPDLMPGSKVPARDIVVVTTALAAISGLAWLLIDAESRVRRALEVEVVERRIAERRADDANAAKSRFLNAMAHEIRTPMNGVLGTADLLLATPLSDEQRRMVDTLRGSGLDLLDLVNTSLDHAKIESGEIEIFEEPFDLRALVHRISELMTPSAHESVELVVRWDENAPDWVSGDRTRVRQVVSNLVSNALKFTEAGRVELRVTAGSGHGVRIEVEDSGIGIPPEDLERIFDPFTQVDPSSERRSVGTGLGLAICHDLAELMGGSLEVRSEVGRGTRFLLAIPLPRTRPAADKGSAALPARFRGRVLVVDDNAVNRKVVGRMLEHVGCQVLAVDGGRAALDAIRDAPDRFDLMLLDREMPGMDGLETVRRLREMPRGRSLTVLAFTGHAMRSEREECLAAGMDGVLVKPVALGKLQETLADYLPAEGESEGEGRVRD